jgi:hypothetical protein
MRWLNSTSKVPSMPQSDSLASTITAMFVQRVPRLLVEYTGYTPPPGWSYGWTRWERSEVVYVAHPVIAFLLVEYTGYTPPPGWSYGWTRWERSEVVYVAHPVIAFLRRLWSERYAVHRLAVRYGYLELSEEGGYFADGTWTLNPGKAARLRRSYADALEGSKRYAVPHKVVP